MSKNDKNWWDEVGSGIPPLPDEDTSEHVKRVSRLAFEDGVDSQINKKLKWHPFDPKKGYRQKRPSRFKLVLVKTIAGDYETDVDGELMFVRNENLPPGLAVGYRKDAAGDKSSPYFVVPGIGGEVVEWCDCLPYELTMAHFGVNES